MSEYFSRSGEPMTLEEWAEKFRDRSYQRLALDRVGDVEVSTLWLGVNHALDGGPPLIFESIVFGGPLDQEQERYCTEDEARAGHDALVRRVRAAA